MKNLDKKLYKFALFGLSGSGKTCILTAMGMERRPAIEGATLTFLPAESSDFEDTKIGSANLTKYTNSLSNGKLPEPTPNALDVVPRYRYSYTDAEIGEAYFEIHDYSGELLNPQLLGNEDEMINRIRNKMRDLDGIIVLAVAPKKGETKSEIPSEINHIIQSFSALQATQTSERKTPVVLVLTKWDRQSDIPQNSENAEDATLVQFFSEHESYRNILDALQNSIGKEYFRCFPISALGHCDRDFPVKLNPLQSYGLTYPFRFLIRQINEMDRQRIETLATNLPKGILPLVLPTGKFADKILQKLKLARFTTFFKPVDESLQLSAKLINRLPESQTEKITAAKMFHCQTIRNIISRSISLFCVCYILWFAFVATLNSRMLSSAELAIKHKTDEAVLIRCEKKLTDYCKGSYFPFTPMHFSKDKAKVLLDKIKYVCEEVAYNNFCTAPLEPQDEKITVLNRYLEKYPQGQYAAEMQDWLNANNEARLVSGNQAPLDNLSQLWATAKASNRKSDVQKVINTANVPNFFQYSNYVKDGQKKQREQILAEANNKLIEIAWDDFASQIRETFNSGNIAAALQNLAGISQKHEKWKALCREILANVESRTDEKIREKGSDYSGAISEVEQIKNAVQQLSNAGADSADTTLRNLNRKITEIEERWDRSLYAAVLTNRTATACDNYLNQAPLKTMRDAVRRYKQYLAQNDSILTIECFDENGNNRQTVSGRLGDTVTVKVDETVDSDNRSTILGLSIKIHITGEKRVTLSELKGGVGVLANGQRLNPDALIPWKTYTASRTRTITGKGFPEEPSLSEWRR
ncbi:MAG: hypothetical protein LBF88_14610 [Planctomycetaceae bacterium]|jgi:hypothetical protein|nr:hypothetical protein [Planctomycetaceae bacterium]